MLFDKMLIDFHAHCYPDAVWPKVQAAIFGRYGTQADNSGTIAGLDEKMNAAGIHLAVVQPVANQPKHVRSVNEWVESVRAGNKNMLFFGAMHPGVEDPYEEVCSLAMNGFRGVKMQPNAGAYYPDSKECFEIYRALQENDMILLTHAGDELKPFTPLYAHPKNFRNVLDSFPELKIIFAHLGGYKTWNDLDIILGYKNAYYDTAMSCEICLKEYLELIERVGIDRVLFGTDFPWYDIQKAVDYTRKALGEKAERIFSENPKKLLYSQGKK
jgi:predicted TIM-barrel fold metal-dependent hydrolase